MFDQSQDGVVSLFSGLGVDLQSVMVLAKETEMFSGGPGDNGSLEREGSPC